jgi:hypothetical protein
VVYLFGLWSLKGVSRQLTAFLQEHLQSFDASRRQQMFKSLFRKEPIGSIIVLVIVLAEVASGIASELRLGARFWRPTLILFFSSCGLVIAGGYSLQQMSEGSHPRLFGALGVLAFIGVLLLAVRVLKGSPHQVIEND